MNLSGRSVRLASRVIEIDDVFEARIVSGFRCGSSASKILFLTASFSVAASITRSHRPNCAGSVALEIRASAAALSPAEILSRLTWRSRLRSISDSAFSTACGFTSWITTS